MTRSDPQTLLYRGIRFSDFDVCWAGPHPFQPGFCFGSTDGRLLFTDAAGRQEFPPTPVSRSGEAVNGVARSGSCLAVSSRAEITLQRVPDGGQPGILQTVIPVGAHGVVAAPSGRFLAPMGPGGLLLLPAQGGHATAFGTGSSSDRAYYFYRATALRGPDGQEVAIAAVRRDGIGFARLPDTPARSPSMCVFRTARFKNLDVVDVCPLAADSLAAAAAGRDGTLVLFRDVLTDKQPAAMKFQGVEGKAYRLLSARGHVILLTDKALYLFANLASRFVSAEAVDHATTQVMTTPIEAVDVNLYGDRTLLVVMPENDVKILDLTDIESGIPAREATPTPATLDPVWDERGITHTTREFALA